MARKAVKFNACDRCPIGKELPATVTVPFSIGDTHYVIDLCDKHQEDMDRAIAAWGMLGREVSVRQQPDSRVQFDEDYRYNAQRLAHLRGKQSRADRAEASVKAGMADMEAAVQAEGLPPAKGLPLDADDFQFTEHARQRMIERVIGAPAALWAASSPERIHPGDRDGIEVRVRQKTKVVLDLRSMRILTVATVDK